MTLIKKLYELIKHSNFFDPVFKLEYSFLKKKTPVQKGLITFITVHLTQRVEAVTILVIS